MLIKEKKITRTFRNGKSVFQQDVMIRLEDTLTEDTLQVIEQRVGFKDTKITFFGKKDKAEKFYAEQVTTTLTNDKPASPFQTIQRS